MSALSKEVRVLLATDPLDEGCVQRGDVLLAATDNGVHAIDDHLFRGNGDRHQSRGAFAIDGLAGDALAEPRGERRESAEIHAGGSRRQGGAEYDGVDLIADETGAAY